MEDVDEINFASNLRFSKQKYYFLLGLLVVLYFFCIFFNKLKHEMCFKRRVTKLKKATTQQPCFQMLAKESRELYRSIARFLHIFIDTYSSANKKSCFCVFFCTFSSTYLLFIKLILYFYFKHLKSTLSKSILLKLRTISFRGNTHTTCGGIRLLSRISRINTAKFPIQSINYGVPLYSMIRRSHTKE